MSSSTLPMAPSLADSEKLFLITGIVDEAAVAGVAGWVCPCLGLYKLP